jgi:hypothetical protein
MRIPTRSVALSPKMSRKSPSPSSPLLSTTACASSSSKPNARLQTHELAALDLNLKVTFGPSAAFECRVGGQTIALIACAWLLKYVMEHVCTILVVAGLLWLIFGRWKQFEEKGKFADCVSALKTEEKENDDQNDTEEESPQKEPWVKKWLIEVIDSSSIENDDAADKEKSAVQDESELEELIVEEMETKEIVAVEAVEEVEDCAVKEYFDDESELLQAPEEPAALDEEDARQDILESDAEDGPVKEHLDDLELHQQSHIPATLEDEDAHQDVWDLIDEPFNIFDDAPSSYNETSNYTSTLPEPEQEHQALQIVDQRKPSQDAALLEKLYSELAGMRKHCENPTFSDGDLYATCCARYNYNVYLNPVYSEHGTSETCTGLPTMPGRSTRQDARDIDFLYHAVEADFTPVQRKYFVEGPKAEYLYRKRDWETHLNNCMEELTKAWYAKNFPDIKTLQDIKEMHKHRTARRTEQCRMIDRGYLGPYHEQRAYLTVNEEMQLNDGSGDYSWYEPSPGAPDRNEWNAKLDLHAKQLGAKRVLNPVLGWLNAVEQTTLLDANAFEACCCGATAMVVIDSYRAEAEQHYYPDLSPHRDFPILVLDVSELIERWEAKHIEAEQTKAMGIVPRSQTIKQICLVHELVSSSLFVLVDTTVHQINDLLSDPTGPLPAPGLKGISQYPDNYRVPPRRVEIPYEKLEPRCKHGLNHPPSTWANYCKVCFPPGTHGDCRECPSRFTVPSVRPFLLVPASMMRSTGVMRRVPAVVSRPNRGSTSQNWRQGFR